LEWGVAVHDEQRLFEMLTLEGAQRLIQDKA
jgi:3-methyladenine DNA glycosylase Tag